MTARARSSAVEQRTHNPLVGGSNPPGPTKVRCHVLPLHSESVRTKRYYVGSTEDLDQRLKQHNGELPGLGRSTVADRPWEIASHAEYSSRSQAMAAERYVKKMKSKARIAGLVEGLTGFLISNPLVPVPKLRDESWRAHQREFLQLRRPKAFAESSNEPF